MTDLVWKDVLAPGTYQTPQGKLDVTPGDVAGLLTRGQRMLAKELQVPVPLAHQDTAKPSRGDELASKVRNNTGWVRGYRMDGDVLQAGILFEDEDVKRKLGSTIKYVSPEIETFRDGDGEDFGPVITHVAVTPRPVWHRQRPFDKPQAFAEVGAKMSFRLSLDKLEKPVDDEKDDVTVNVDADDDTDTPETPEKPAAPAVQPGADRLGEVISLLKEVKGLELPNDTNVDSFLNHLRVALIAQRSAGTDDAAGGSPGMDMQGGAPTEQQPMGGYAMSLDKCGGCRARQDRLDELGRKERLARIKAAKDSGRIGPAKAEELEAKLTGYQLSLDDKPQLVDELLAFVESMPENATWAGKQKRLSLDNVREHQRPDSVNQEEVDKIANRLSGGRVLNGKG